MNRTLLTSVLVFTTTIAATNLSVADSRNRMGSGGINRAKGTVSSHHSSSSFRGKPVTSGGFTAGLTGGLSGNGPGQSANAGNGFSGKTLRPGTAISLPQHGHKGGNLLPNSGRPVVKLPGVPDPTKRPETGVIHGRRDVRIPIPHHTNPGNGTGIGTGRPGHLNPVPGGVKSKPIALNIASILKHRTPAAQLQPQIQTIVQTAPKHLCIHPHFHWWVNICHHHCHSNFGCWNVDVQYWDCWTPCHWQIVQCEKLSYYVGMSCVHIPDMQAYGVQSVIQGSPAHAAGLLPGDLILMVNGQSVFQANLLDAELIDGRLDLQVVREGNNEPFPLTVFPRLVQTVSF